MGSISGPIPVVCSDVERTGYWCRRSGVQFSGWSNRHSVAIGLPPLRRFSDAQAIDRGNGTQWCMQGKECSKKTDFRNFNLIAAQPHLFRRWISAKLKLQRRPTIVEKLRQTNEFLTLFFVPETQLWNRCCI